MIRPGESLISRAVGIVGASRVQAQLTEHEWSIAKYIWRAWARRDQLAPDGAWSTWLVLAGRGWGKTRTGAEFIRDEVESGRMRRIALVAPTAGDARDVMVEGESGILAISPPWHKPKYEPSKRRLTWPNGARATVFSGEEPNRLRGPQFDGYWADELAAWKYPKEAWDNLQFGLRLGTNPRGIVTTTPRPTQIIRDLIKNARTSVTKGSTYDNAANLAPIFLQAIREAYEGTRLGRQEIFAEVLTDNPNALWTLALIEANRVLFKPKNLRRVSVAVDPAGSSQENSNETGITVGGIGPCSCKGKVEEHGFLWRDESGIYTPGEWATKTMDCYTEEEADRIVAERNFGGDMVESTIRSDPRGAHVKVEMVNASRGKARRAEPVQALDEQGKVHHVGTFAKLEDQMTQWDPMDPRALSPDRMDSRVWLFTDLMLGAQSAVMRTATRPLGTSRYPTRRR